MLKLVFCLVCFVVGGYGYTAQDIADFNNFIIDFNKIYATTTDRNNANFYFIYNRNQATAQNNKADRNTSSSRQAVNQFSDIRLIHFAALLPKSVYPSLSYASTPAETQDALPEVDIISDIGLNITVEDQGVSCSSSWAYATAKAVEILNALQTGNLSPQSLSAQELIDCTSMGTGCTTQVRQVGFEYLTQYSTILSPVDTYPNTNTATNQGFCLPTQITGDVRLATYATISDGDDDSLKRFVSNNIPVVVEINPATFGFMQYSSGVYVPTTPKATSSQFLVVVGYGYDANSGLDYWNCLNSFGTTWGENGYIRIVRSTKYPLAKNAIFPNTF
ncbi:uncharacterized protein [Drosophila tropicalis]|uniref:uncharacterized protein n=1 Tax=Drosophila tropicalis TaxID=46794 RepID=UPI0035AC1949